MHELSIATGIIEIVTEEAARVSATKVTRIDVEIGTLAGIEKDSLMFSWELVTEGTIASKADLVIREIQAIAECLVCHRTFPLEHPLAICPHCQSNRYQINIGKELRISSLEVE